jgi:hypothetical protein
LAIHGTGGGNAGQIQRQLTSTRAIHRDLRPDSWSILAMKARFEGVSGAENREKMAEFCGSCVAVK